MRFLKSKGMKVINNLHSVVFMLHSPPFLFMSKGLSWFSPVAIRPIYELNFMFMGMDLAKTFFKFFCKFWILGWDGEGAFTGGVLSVRKLF